MSTTPDLDGLDIVLPGAGLPLRDGVITWLWLGGSLSFLMTAMALGASYSSGQPLLSPLTLLLGTAPWVGLLPFLLLGALRAWGTPIKVRIEPTGMVSLHYLAEPIVLPAASIVAVTVEEQPPRVVLTLDGRGPQRWTMRTPEHAHWLASQLHQVLERQQGLREGERSVPASLEGLRDRSPQ